MAKLYIEINSSRTDTYEVKETFEQVLKLLEANTPFITVTMADSGLKQVYNSARVIALWAEPKAS